MAVAAVALLLGEGLLGHLVGLAHLAVYLLLAVGLLVGKEQQAVALLVAAPVALQVELLLLDLLEEMEPLVVAIWQVLVVVVLVDTQVLGATEAKPVMVRRVLAVLVAEAVGVTLTPVAQHKAAGAEA